PRLTSVSLCLHTPPPTAQPSTLSLHDALPISPVLLKVKVTFCALPSWTASRLLGRTAEALSAPPRISEPPAGTVRLPPSAGVSLDRKSTRLNSSHVKISYAVFCLNNKNQ